MLDIANKINNKIKSSGGIRREPHMVRLMDDIRKKIKKEGDKREIRQKDIARVLGYSESNFSAIKIKGRLRVVDLIKIAELFEMDVKEFLPGAPNVDIEKMSFIDLIRIICHKEIEKYLEHEYAYLKDKKKGGGIDG